MLTVRPATPRDTDAVDALLRRVYPRLLKEDYPPSVRVLVLPRISRAQPALMRSGTYYVAELAGAVVGAGGWTPDRRDPGVGHVRHVVTSDLHLRQGIGRAILERSFSEARAAGAQSLVCWSTFTAEPFYASLGFRRLGVIEVPLGHAIRFPAVDMRRRI